MNLRYLALLEALSEQLACNFQRELTRDKDFSWKWWKSFSLEAALNRLELCDLTTGFVSEQSIGLLALSKANDAHAIAHLDGTLLFLNPHMKKLANLRSDEAFGLDIFGLLDRFQTEMLGEPKLIVRKVLQSEEGFEKELSFPEKNLTLVFKLSLVKAPVDGGSIHETYVPTKPLCFLMTLRDISSQKELEKLRSDMVSLMSHELRTPITSIKGFAELLQDDENIPLESREFLSIIASESQRLSKMLTTFLSVAKLAAIGQARGRQNSGQAGYDRSRSGGRDAGEREKETHPAGGNRQPVHPADRGRPEPDHARRQPPGR